MSECNGELFNDIPVLICTGCRFFAVEEVSTKKLYALKEVKKASLCEEQDVRAVLEEKRILMDNRHPYLLGLTYAFQTRSKLCFVMEYIGGGELFHHLQQQRFFPASRVKLYTAEIVSALVHLHARGYVYRDLKPENIVFDSKGHIRVVDYGTARMVEWGRGRSDAMWITCLPSAGNDSRWWS